MKNATMKSALYFSIVGVALIITTNSYAIESGTYVCQSAFGAVELVLKKSGRANTEGVRGFWKNYGDEAVVIKDNWVLLDKGNGKYTYRGTVCKKETAAEKKAKEVEKIKLKAAKEARYKAAVARNRKQEAEKRKQENLQVAKCKDINNYKINGDGTVTDKSSGLMWKRCSEGLSGEKCDYTQNGTDSLGMVNYSKNKFTWDEALQLGKKLNGDGGFGGYSNWRLPTKDELLSIMRRSCGSPAINQIVFPHTIRNQYWTSSSDAYDIMTVGFGTGYATKSPDYIYHFSRLVRSGELLKSKSGLNQNKSS